MSAFTNLIANLFSGFLPSVISMFTGLDNKGWTPDKGAQHVAEDLASLQDQNLISNYFRKTTGASLTDAEVQANEWSRQQVLDAWSRQMEADNTKYQRQVLDMQSAGLNPMLAAGASAHVPSAAVASSVSPSSAAFNLGDIASLLRLGADIKNIEADTAKKSADTVKASEETKGTVIENQYKAESLRLHNEALEVSNSLTRVQVSKINKELDDIDASIALKIKQADTEVKRQGLADAQALLARMNARQASEMLPYMQAYYQAQTDGAKHAAALAAAECMYKNGLIAHGYIDYIADEAYGKSRSAKAKADVDEVKAGFRTGNFGESSPVAKWYQNDNKVATRIINTVTNVLDNLNPVANLFVGAFGN